MFGLWLPDGLLFRAGAKRPAITMMPNCEYGTHVELKIEEDKRKLDNLF